MASVKRRLQNIGRKVVRETVTALRLDLLTPPYLSQVLCLHSYTFQQSRKDKMRHVTHE